MTIYKIEQKLRIFDPKLWGSSLFDDGAISPTGQLIAVRIRHIKDLPLGGDNIFVYDLDGILKLSLGGGQQGQRGLSFLGDDYHIVVARDEDILRKYRLGDTEKLPYWGGKEQNSVDPNRLYKEENSNQPIRLIAVSDYGNLLLYEKKSHQQDRLVCVDTNLPEKEELFDVESRDIYHAQFSSNDDYLGIGTTGKTNDRSIVLSTRDGQILWESEHSSSQRFICFSPDNKNFITSSPSGGKLEIWSTKSWIKINETQEDITLDQFYIGAYSPNRKILVTGPNYPSGVIYLWDTSDFKIIGQTPSPHGSNVKKIKFSLDGNKLITIGNRDIIIWQVQKEQKMDHPEIHITGSNHSIVVGDNANVNPTWTNNSQEVVDLRQQLDVLHKGVENLVQSGKLEKEPAQKINDEILLAKTESAKDIPNRQTLIEKVTGAISMLQAVDSARELVQKFIETSLFIAKFIK